MRNKLFLLLAFLSINLFSQNIEFVPDNFPSKNLYNKAVENIEKGDKLFFTGDFESSLPYFIEAQKLNNSNALLNFKIGVCYYKLNKLEESHPYFLKARLLDRKIDPKIDYALACSYQAIENYKEAIHYFNIYLKGLSKLKKEELIKDVQTHIRFCENQLQPKKHESQEQENLSIKNPEKIQKDSPAGIT